MNVKLESEETSSECKSVLLKIARDIEPEPEEGAENTSGGRRLVR